MRAGLLFHYFVVWALILVGVEAKAVSLAVLPLDDLSQGDSSINQAMTTLVREEMARHGVTVVSRERVETFMTEHRIRRLGALLSEEVLALHDELQADLVLLSSLCQRSETAATLGMTVSLLRTSDAKTIWTSTKGVSLLAEQRLLGIDAPRTMDDLQSILVRDVFSSWPPDLQPLIGSRTLSQERLDNEAAIDVDSVLFTPKYVRPGQEVNCTIRFSVKPEDYRAKVFIRVGNRIHTAKTEDGVYYQVSWIGTEEKSGTPMQVAMNTPEPRVVSGIWDVGTQDASYPVSLILEWVSGRRAETYLGTYVVDSHPPELMLKFQTKTMDGQPAFRTELPISVVFKRREPVTKWEFTVSSPEGKRLLAEKGSEQLPESFLWRGQGSKNQRLDPGLYDITLSTWDRAGNKGSTAAKVRLLAAKPGLNLAVARDRGTIRATLSALDQVGISYWRMEVWSRDNTMLKSFEGETLPARFDIPDGDGLAATDCIVQVRDVLGMKATKKVPNILALATGKDSAGGKSPSRKSELGEDEWHLDF